MAIDTIKSSAVLDGAIATADIADDAVTSAKLDTNISVDGNLGLGTSVSTRKLNVNAGSYGHILLDTANAAHGIQILGQANAAANSGFDIQYAASTGLKVRTLAVQPLSLQTSASAGSPSDRLHIHTSGVVSIPQGIELGSGVDATAANVLDDYEEGTWTPIIHSAGGTPTTYSFGVNGNYGYYTKVGNIVTAHAHCVFQRGTATGAIDLGGLPFTSANVTTGYASTTTSYWSLATAIVKVEMHLNPNSTRGSNTTRIATGATTSMSTSLQSGNLNTGSNTILYSITYRSA